MSGAVRDAIEGHRSTAQRIQAFLWTGRPHKSEPIPRTPEELAEFLEEIRTDSWSTYNSGAQSMGWSE